MSGDERFAAVLRGLLANRRLTPRAVSRASTRAESTINQLLNGSLAPTADLLRDIAPALQMDVPDLLVIAGLPVETAPGGPGPSAASQQIGSLVAAASHLSPEDVRRLVEQAREMRGPV